MLWHCYHRQVAKVHQQSKYLSKLTSSFYSLQSRRRKGIQPLRNVKIKERERLLVFVKGNGVAASAWSRCDARVPDRCPRLGLTARASPCLMTGCAHPASPPARTLPPRPLAGSPLAPGPLGPVFSFQLRLQNAPTCTVQKASKLIK